MAATSQFASRYKKDLSTETLRTKVARRKSMLQKENRHKLFEKGRQFGLADVNVQLAKERGISQLSEASEMCSQENSSVKQKQSTNAATRKINERREMLQRYKEEKELRKLREQREKAKKGVFKVGLYKPTAPGFLSLVPEGPVIVKPREKVAPDFSGRITRSKAKIQEEKTVIPTASKHSMVSASGHSVRPTQAGRKQMSTAKATEKDKVLKTAVPLASDVRITRAASSAARQMMKTAAAATAGNQSQRKTANAGKQKQAVKPDITEVIPSKHEVDKNAQLNPVMKGSAADSMHSVSVEIQEEQTSVENKNNSASGRPRTRSFAPQNFVFQPLNGLATYKVTPMTPSRANAFLTPNAFWDFSTSPVIIEKSSEIKAQDPNLKSQVSPADKGIQEQHTSTSLKGGKASESDKKTSIQRSNETIPVSPDTTVLEMKSDDVREQEHDVPYFRNILRSETERLMSQCLQWDVKFELDIPEDAKDLIRTTVGQTKLLIAERFKQFEGLVDNCEFKRGEKETTCTDLDGFWDMVNFQIEDVNKKFDNLKKLQDNEWQPLDVPTKAIVKKTTIPNGVSKPKLGAAGRAAAQNRLAAIKAAMRAKMNRDEVADCTHQEKVPEVETVVFEAGFFRIESPVKTFPGLLPKTPHTSSQRTSEKLATPRSSSRALLQSIPSVLRDPEDATAKQTTPVPKGFHPARNLTMQQFPAGETPPLEKLPGRFLERSIPVVEEPCPVAGPAEGTEGLENSSSELKVTDGTEEMELSAAEQGQDIVMGSLEEETCTATNFAQSGEPRIHQTDVSCSDLTSIGRNPLERPMLDAELPFTPVKTKAQMFAAAETFSDLIVFSPLSPPGEK